MAQSATYGFQNWLKERCVRHKAISGGVALLLRDYNRCLKRHKLKLCGLDEFAALLENEGIKMIDVQNTLMTPGLGFRNDFEVYYERARP